MSATNKEAIAQRLRQAREGTFETAADAARALRMKPVTVRAHENGQNGVNPRELEDYARTYGVNIGWLLTGEGPELPQADRHDQGGLFMRIHTTVEDGVWLKTSDEEADWPTRHTGVVGPDEDYVTYTDPRFAGELINPVRVATSHGTAGVYLNGDILFVVDSSLTGYRHGDHVLIVREDRKREICEWTLRRVEKTEDDFIFAPLISFDPPFSYSQDENGLWTWVVGVVIASQSRRPVPEAAITHARRELREIGKFLRKHPHHDNPAVAKHET